MQERSEGVVLRAVDYSETSRIVTFLTPSRGQLACMVKGARRPGSATGSALDSFNRVEIVYHWKESRSVQTLTEASLLNGFGALKADFDKSLYGSFILELAYKLSGEAVGLEEMYTALVHNLEDLSRWPGPPRIHAAWQTLRLLEAGGVAPAVESCVECGAPVPDGGCKFSMKGGVVCTDCSAPHRLKPETREALAVFSNAKRACPTEVAPDTLFALLSRFATEQTGAAFRSLQVIEQIGRS
ncbi:MAG: DNA repair protein RecO [Candidatus Hydrogenedentota bacterium]